jgi:catechol 2,3-dioxygenase
MASEASEPILDVAHLAHVELLTPDPDGTLAFFTQMLGMCESGRDGRSVFLRGYEERYFHSLQITEARAPGLGHAAWRSRSAAALERRVAAISASGLGDGWREGDTGHGPAYRFHTPDGHVMELFWGVDYAEPRDGEATPLLNRPSRRPRTGVPVRRLDHINLMTADTRSCRDVLVDLLGFRERERAETPDGTPVASWLSVTNLSHDIGLVPEPTNARGRFHHACFHYTSAQHLFDVVELARESGYRVEHGPGRHGIGGATFLYLVEPGGNRIELMGDPGYMIFDPDWRTVVWSGPDIFEVGAVWAGSPLPDSFWTEGTPPTPMPG